jgi:2-methylisocitrate lyase-like PEP mutase family enzyme
MTSFRDLQAPGRLLILPNAWDAGSARVIEDAGAEAIATTSSGVAWARGYPDGNALPTRSLAASIGEIVRVIRVPLSADVEAGYSDDPRAVGETVAAVIGAGAVGINLEDGAGPPDLLCAKIEAVRAAALRADVDLFVNARTDVYLKQLVPAEKAIEATIERAKRYRAAGCDGVFVPGLADESAIRAVVAGIAPLPLNVMAYAGLPAAVELRALGVRRLSAGAAIASAALGRVRSRARAFLSDGRSEPLFDDSVAYGPTNALFPRS